MLSPRGFLGRTSGQRFVPSLPPPALVRNASILWQIVSISKDVGSGRSEDPRPFDRSKKTRPSTTTISWIEIVEEDEAHRNVLAARAARPMDVHVLKGRDERATFYLAQSARRDPDHQVPAMSTHEGFAVKIRRSA